MKHLRYFSGLNQVNGTKIMLPCALSVRNTLNKIIKKKSEAVDEFVTLSVQNDEVKYTYTSGNTNSPRAIIVNGKNIEVDTTKLSSGDYDVVYLDNYENEIEKINVISSFSI